MESTEIDNTPPAAQGVRKRRYLILALALVVLAIGAFAGNRWWRDREAEAAALPAVKLASIHLTNVLRLKGAESATFKEYFEKTDVAVSEIDKSSIALRSGADITHPSVAQAVSYMEAAQEAARASGMLMRKRMEFRTAVRAMDRTDDLPSGDYMRDYRIKRLTQVLEDVKKAREEYSGAASSAKVSLVAFRGKNDQMVTAYGKQVEVDSKALKDNLDEAETIVKELTQKAP